MARNNNQNSNNNRNNNSNEYNYNPNLLFRPDSLYPGSLFSPRRQPPQQGGQGHKCRGKTPRPERFNNKRCRNPDTEIKYPYMRQKLKNRLRNLDLHGADGDTDGYLKWIWPYRKSEHRGSYDRNNRYKVVKRPDLNGIPRFSINHYLKQNCAASAITTTLPRLIKNKNKNDDKIYFSTATESQPKKQADLDWKRKIIADRIGKLPEQQRRRVCRQIKENYVERNKVTKRWSELYNNDMLKRMHETYLGEKRRGPLELIRQLLLRPETFDDDYYKKGLYTVAKKHNGPAAVSLKERGDAEQWGNLGGNPRSVSRTKQYKMMKAYIEENDTQALNLNPTPERRSTPAAGRDGRQQTPERLPKNLSNLNVPNLPKNVQQALNKQLRSPAQSQAINDHTTSNLSNVNFSNVNFSNVNLSELQRLLKGRESPAGR